jgi:hypothetical protein
MWWPTRHAWIALDYERRILGCRRFSPATFAKIMKAADKTADAQR